MAKRDLGKLGVADLEQLENPDTVDAASMKAGIDESALAKFYNGQRGFTTDTLDRLGAYLGRFDLTSSMLRTSLGNHYSGSRHCPKVVGYRIG